MSENIEKRMFTGPKMKSSNWVLDYCRHFQLKLGSVSYYGFFFCFFVIFIENLLTSQRQSENQMIREENKEKKLVTKDKRANRTT